MMKTLCLYCGIFNEEIEVRCIGCGAPLPENKNKQTNERRQSSPNW